MTNKASPNSNMLKDCLKAFFIGGSICLIGQGITLLYTDVFFLQLKEARMLNSVTLVFIGAFLTCLGVYDKIAKHGGAGTLVPITGFANAIVSPAIEFKSEGVILGTCAKMFTIAGPVLVYGINASVLYGLIYYLVIIFK